ncbi:hypothetical protein KI387_041179, partial [Taxus chinensis]
HQDQLDALLPGIDGFGSGSIIIVISRELGVLTSWGISSIYNMKGLDERVLIRGIKAATNGFYEDLGISSASHSQAQTPFQGCMELVRSSSRDFRRCRLLELVVVRDNNFNKEFATLSTGLVWLRSAEKFSVVAFVEEFESLELHQAGNLVELWGDEAD